jgi:alpha-galactosidase
MRVELTRIEAEVDGRRLRAELSGPGTVRLGPLDVELTVAPVVDGTAGGPATQIAWAVANRGDGTVKVRSVAAVLLVVDPAPPVRMFRHGYQSWTPTAVATFGVDADPSTRAGFEFLQAVHHADPRTVTAPDELRSEWVTVLVDQVGEPLLVGFDDGRSHDGTLRLRHSPGDAPGGDAPGGDAPGGGIELWAEAFLGEVALPAGARRPLHPVVIDGTGPAADLLDHWAHRAGTVAAARVEAPYQVGWCSWYQYFHGVTEDAVRHNLALAGDWPFDVFQLDDGFQAAIGDWLTPAPTFPSGLAGVADAVTGRGLQAGVWLAPFLAAPDSQVATAHPDWMARTADGRHPLRAWWNPGWGGDGFMTALDTTHPEVLDHLEQLAATVVAMGYTYLKLDFTFAPSIEGRWADPTRTPAERVRAGYDAVRRGAGDGTFILGCGVPLSNVVGVVDGCRIGQDVAPLWSLSPADEIVAGYLGIQPATRHAYVNTATRSFMHRRLWLNDPDCLMLRTTDTALSPRAARTWAHAVGVSGGMALVSDDLALLDGEARRLLDETVALGRASDDAVRQGRAVVVPDLLDASEPSVMDGGGHRLVTDAGTGTSQLSPIGTTPAPAPTGAPRP